MNPEPPIVGEVYFEQASRPNYRAVEAIMSTAADEPIVISREIRRSKRSFSLPLSEFMSRHERFAASAEEALKILEAKEQAAKLTEPLFPLQAEASDGVSLIAQERRDQIERHGYSLEKDKITGEHDGLAMAAACYATPGRRRLFRGDMNVPNGWPWAHASWTPSPGNRIKELAKAGALIAAEIDRLQDAEPSL